MDAWLESLRVAGKRSVILNASIQGKKTHVAELEDRERRHRERRQQACKLFRHNQVKWTERAEREYLKRLVDEAAKIAANKVSSICYTRNLHVHEMPPMITIFGVATTTPATAPLTYPATTSAQAMMDDIYTLNDEGSFHDDTIFRSTMAFHDGTIFRRFVATLIRGRNGELRKPVQGRTSEIRR